MPLDSYLVWTLKKKNACNSIAAKKQLYSAKFTRITLLSQKKVEQNIEKQSMSTCFPLVVNHTIYENIAEPLTLSIGIKSLCS